MFSVHDMIFVIIFQLNEQTLGLDYFMKTALQVKPVPLILLGFLESDVFVNPWAIDIIRRTDDSGKSSPDPEWEFVRTNNASLDRRGEWAEMIRAKLPNVNTSEGVDSRAAGYLNSLSSGMLTETLTSTVCLNALGIPTSFVGEDEFPMPMERYTQDFVNCDRGLPYVGTEEPYHKLSQLGNQDENNVDKSRLEHSKQANVNVCARVLESSCVHDSARSSGQTGGVLKSFSQRGASMMFGSASGQSRDNQKPSALQLLKLTETALAELISLLNCLKCNDLSDSAATAATTATSSTVDRSSLFSLRNPAVNDFISTYESTAFDYRLLVDDDDTLSTFLDRKDLFVVGGDESSSHLSSALLLEALQSEDLLKDSRIGNNKRSSFSSGVWISQFRVRNVLMASTAFHDICRQVEALKSLNMKDIDKNMSNDMKYCFLTNLYNLISLHAAVLLPWPAAQDACGRAKWQSLAKYVVSSTELSLLKLEHGILRAMSQKLLLPTITAGCEVRMLNCFMNFLL